MSAATDRLAAVYDEELARVAAARGAVVKPESDLSLGPAGRAFLRERMQGPFHRLWERFGDLEEQETELSRRIVELEEGPPDEDEAEVLDAAEQWRAAMSRLDGGYEGAWREMVEEIERAWSTDLLPRLDRVGRTEPRRVPEWVQLAGLAAVTLLLAVLLVFFLVR